MDHIYLLNITHMAWLFKIENGKTEGKKREECGSLVAKNDAPLQYTLDSTLLGMYSLLYWIYGFSIIFTIFKFFSQ